MQAVIVYESTFGSTRYIADAISDGLRATLDVQIVRAAEAATVDLSAVALLVVGAPTHVHGMPRPTSRRSAPEYATKPGRNLVLEQGADTEPGVREWLGTLGHLSVAGVAFDTRVKGPSTFTGRASRGITKGLVEHGVTIAEPAESFLVDKHSHLLPGEVARAEAWGTRLGTTVASEASATGGVAIRRAASGR